MRILNTFICTVVLLFGMFISAYAQGINLDYGLNQPRTRYMQSVGNAAGEDGQFVGVRVEREICAKSTGNALYFAIDNEKLYQRPSSTWDIINVEYFDNAAREIKLIYDSVDDPNKVAEPVIQTTGSNRWKSTVFYLEDAYFSDRQKYNADFRLECADTMIINAVRVAPIDYYIEYGQTNNEFLISPKMVNAGDSMTEIIVLDDGQECIVTTAESQYLYCDIDDDEIFQGDFPEYFISIEYLDWDPPTQMRLQYDGESEPYQDKEWWQGKGWGTFKTYTWEVSDGYMGGRQNDGADFRINFQQPGPPIKRIMLGFLDYGPSAVKETKSASVSNFMLEQNYPNPFNPTTTIRFELPETAQVTLTIFDSHGRQLVTLVDEEKTAGLHTVSFDGARYASGVYFCHLKAGDRILQKKMMLVK